MVLLVASADTRALLDTVAGIEPSLLALPIAASLLSYAAMARSYQELAQAAGARFSFWEMVRITFVANSMNYLVATGGLSGFAARLYLFTRRGIPGSTATTISLAQGFITNVSLLLFVVIGFVSILPSRHLSQPALVTSSAILGLLSAIAILVVANLLRRDFRRRLFFLGTRSADRLLHRLLPHAKSTRIKIWRFQRNLNRGIDFLLERKQQMVAPAFWILVDWTATFGILYAAFLCVGQAIPASVLILGFAVGVSLSLISLIPGGLGLMEGSMAAVFAGFVPFEKAVVAVLIFRVAFHVLPLVVSLFFFRGLLRESRAQRPAGTDSSR